MTDYAKAVIGFLGLLLAVVLLLVFALYPSETHGQVMTWHDSTGKPVAVSVSNEACPVAQGRGCSLLTVFLGGNPRRLMHELAHVAGMTHSAWRRNGFGEECATVTASGHATGYEVGDVICAGFDGSDAVWKR